MMQYPQDFTQSTELPLWISSETAAFNYSEGDATESYLTQCLTDATDLSSLSQELAQKMRDWPTRYHLSPARSNLFRPLTLNKDHQVLEIGAGCGALSRYLGETAGSVVAIEGSPKRAEIAARRCRDLENVSVVCANFQEVALSQQFDVITLIGVLEYSGKYIDSETPYHTLLELVRPYLKPSGVLVIAIENQLGLKYFSGCGEDHTGVLFDGLEGYHAGHQVSTFGKKQLKRLLKDSGLEHTHFLYPFPDYKIPECVLNLDAPDAENLSQWIPFSNAVDHGKSRWQSCQEYLVSRQLEANGVLQDLANSFLVLATANESHLTSYYRPNVLVHSFESHRIPMQQQELRTGNERRWQPLAIAESGVPVGSQTWGDHTPLTEQWFQSLRQSHQEPEVFMQQVQRWMAFLKQQTNTDGHLPGNCFEAIPRNLWISQESQLFLPEGTPGLEEQVPLSVVIVRGLLYFYQDAFALLAVHPEYQLVLGIETFLAHMADKVSLPAEEVASSLMKEWQLSQEGRLVPYRTFQSFLAHQEPVTRHDSFVKAPRTQPAEQGECKSNSENTGVLGQVQSQWQQWQHKLRGI